MTTELRQTIDEVIRDLVSTYPGVIQRVDKAENMAMLRLNRRGSTWAVCIARAEPADAQPEPWCSEHGYGCERQDCPCGHSLRCDCREIAAYEH